MYLCLAGHGFRYECENLCRLFFPYDPVRVTEAPQGENGVLTAVTGAPGDYVYAVSARYEGKALSREKRAENLEEYGVTSLLYEVLRDLTGISPAWGMLTGIHPIKLLRQYTEKHGEEEGLRLFRERCFVSAPKADLARRTLLAQRPFVSSLDPRDFCLYVGIPFCPSRCSYCSFVSESVVQAKKLVRPYFDLLLEELRHTGALAKALGLRLQAVYIGGGTPTTLSAEQLSRLCGQITESFGPPALGEFTVEAGRPDTVTREKLTALRAAGVTRVSVNPQTLSDGMLRAIGRRHSAQETLDAYALTREAGFSAINCDLIVGLPGDTLEGFRQSLDGVIALGAENITVHSLALKRSANLLSEGGDLGLHGRREEVAAMVDYSVSRLSGEGYIPYYLYRQSRTAGNLENTGWAKPGTECVYNIHSTDEEMTILACGAGGVTKAVEPGGALSRIFDFKYPYEYISRFSEILERKEGLRKIFS